MSARIAPAACARVDELGRSRAAAASRSGSRRRRQVDLVRHLLGERAVARLELGQRDEERARTRRRDRAARARASASREQRLVHRARARPRPAPAWSGSCGRPCRRRRRPGARPPRPGAFRPDLGEHLPRPRRAPARGCGGRRPAAGGRTAVWESDSSGSTIPIIVYDPEPAVPLLVRTSPGAPDGSSSPTTDAATRAGTISRTTAAGGRSRCSA